MGFETHVHQCIDPLSLLDSVWSLFGEHAEYATNRYWIWGIVATILAGLFVSRHSTYLEA